MKPAKSSIPCRLLTRLPIAPAPKHTQRRIVWHDDGKSGTAILLVGYCPDTLPYFLGLADEVLKTFPDANLREATCSKVTNSPSIKGFTVLMVPINGPKRAVEGYEPWKSIDFNY